MHTEGTPGDGNLATSDGFFVLMGLALNDFLNDGDQSDSLFGGDGNDFLTCGGVA